MIDGRRYVSGALGVGQPAGANSDADTMARAVDLFGYPAIETDRRTFP